MIINNIEIEPPIKIEEYEDSNLNTFIETIRNLQNNIIQELNKSIINFDYIDECNSEIRLVLGDIRELQE